jgi:murein DD-endopeptidase
MKGITRRDLLKVTTGAGLAALTTPLFGCSASSASAAESIPLRVPVDPTPVTQMGETVYGYELYIGKALSLNLSVSKVDIMADGVLVKTYEGAELSKCLMKKTDTFSAEEAIFTGRDYDILLAWPVLSKSSPVPSQFSHRVFFSNGLVAEGGAVAVIARTTLIAPPVRGGRWWAANGPSNFDRHHRNSIFDFFSKTYAAQRFATDWLQVDPVGYVFSGTGKSCTDYFCYGADLLAVADGTVVEARDGIPEGTPPDNYAQTTLQNVFGNSVILDIGEGRYAAYAHIIPGTVTVRIGESVHQGQVIGKLGNSGNSTGPHLHFHLCNGRDGIFSEGLPFSFASYELLGSLPEDDALKGIIPWTPSAAPQLRTAEMPLREQVLNL